jgi:hypothetical protein
MFIVTPKKVPATISKKSLYVNLLLYRKTNGIRNSAAKKKRIKARVKGGTFVKATLKIGDPAPQIILAITSATTGDSIAFTIHELGISFNHFPSFENEDIQ